MTFNEQWREMSLLEKFKEEVAAGKSLKAIEAARDFFRANRGIYTVKEVNEAYEIGYQEFDQKRNEKTY